MLSWYIEPQHLPCRLGNCRSFDAACLILVYEKATDTCNLEWHYSRSQKNSVDDLSRGLQIWLGLALLTLALKKYELISIFTTILWQLGKQKMAQKLAAAAEPRSPKLNSAEGRLWVLKCRSPRLALLPCSLYPASSSSSPPSRS